MRWYLEQLVWNPDGDTTTKAELTLDFWLATRAQLSGGTTMVDRIRAFNTAAGKVAEICGGRVSPVPFKTECHNLGRLFYRAAAGFQGRAKLLFPDEVKTILALHQEETGISSAAQARSAGLQWKWKPEEARLTLPPPKWSFEQIRKTEEVDQTGRGRPKGCKTGRCIMYKDQEGQFKALGEGKQRPSRGGPKGKKPAQQQQEQADVAAGAPLAPPRRRRRGTGAAREAQVQNQPETLGSGNNAEQAASEENNVNAAPTKQQQRKRTRGPRATVTILSAASNVVVPADEREEEGQSIFLSLIHI